MQYIHSARWINQLKDAGHEVFVFDCLDEPIHEDLVWTNFTTNWSERKIRYIKGEYFLEKKMPRVYRFIEPYLKITASERLKTLIEEIQPDLIHSFEMQSETYPIIPLSKKKNFKWCYSCWGSDLYYYNNYPVHKKLIKECLSQINYVFLECKRDKNLVLESGYKNEVLGTGFPGGGGYDIEKFNLYCEKTENRKLILIKGYEHKFGRALTILNAIELIVEKIKEYDMYVYSAHHSVVEKIEKMNLEYGLNIGFSSRYNQISHDELLEKFGQAKIAIGNSISDGVPNTLMETIILRAFPIQSNPGGASEDYITHGENGFLIANPEDPEEIAALISKALSSEELLNNASIINKELSKKLEYKIIKNNVLKAYAKIESEL
jgi:glycosyltransferase involved in cell wall biosynthesis